MTLATGFAARMIVALAIGMTSLIAAPLTATAADLNVLCSNGFQSVMVELGPRYERQSGNALHVRYGLAAMLGKEIEDGAAFDVAILAPPQIDGLIGKGRLAADSRVVLARSGMGVMVRSGAPKPDVSTVEAFKRTLLTAKSIAFPPQGQSGIYLAGLIVRLGLADSLKDKMRPVASGPLTAQAVARGEAEIGITPIPELLAVKGVALAGPLPPPVQNYIVQTAAVARTAGSAAAARDFLNFLRSPENAHVMIAKGMELP
jgi:molybdate transport system substrate-binding protein